MSRNTHMHYAEDPTLWMHLHCAVPDFEPYGEDGPLELEVPFRLPFDVCLELSAGDKAAARALHWSPFT